MSSPPTGSSQPSGWSNDLFRDPAAVQQTGYADRGLINQVPIVAILLIVQGVLELLFCVVCFGFSALVFFAPQKEFEGMRGLGVLMAAVSTPALISALLRITAGIFNIRYRRRVLGIVALAVGLSTMLTGYCAPTSIALAVYGLIVYVNEPVMMAFRMGDSGRPSAEIRAAYLLRR